MSINLTTLIQVLPYAQNVAHAELVSPEAQLTASQALAQQALKEENKQVAKVEKQEESEAIHGDRQQRRGRRQMLRRRRQAPKPEPEEAAPSAEPFAGHIINLKV